MAESAKALKLAAARKMLKQYQQKKPNTKNENDVSNPAQAIQPEQLSETNTGNTTPVSFTTSEGKENRAEIQNICIEKYETQSNPDLTISNIKNNEMFFNNSLFQDSNTFHLDYFDKISQNVNPAVCCVNDSAIAASIEANLSQDLIKQEILQQEEFVNTPEVEVLSQIKKEESILTTVVDTNPVESALENNLKYETIHRSFEPKPFSNAESLRQLSSQINNAIEKEFDTTPSEFSQLEHRNQELAALLDNEKLTNEKLNLQMREYLSRIAQLELELQQSRIETDIKVEKELGPLQEQLQYHIQTVGILVGEKTELTMALNQSQLTAKQKTMECEELQSRLKASRHRVSDLEKEISLLKSTRLESNIYPQEYDTLKMDFQSLKEQFEEVSEECNEIKQKFNLKANECMTLQKELQEKNSQISFIELRLQQLSTDENIQIQTELENLHKQKISLEQQVADLTQSIKSMSADRNQANQQYQQYVQQLNGQLQNLAEKLESVNKENETFANHEQSLLKHVEDLEKRLQQLQVEKENIPLMNPKIDAELQKLKLDNDMFTSRYNELENKYQDETKHSESLKNKLKESQFKVEELEGVIEQLKLDRPDATKLLATMESDKVAASRAIEQNTKLKTQIEELTEAFVQMSNSKLELTEKWESEKHRALELAHRVEHCEAELEKLITTITFKDKELMELRTISENYNKEILQQHQLVDRLRHYEVQGNVSDIIQQELQNANETIERLTAENEKLNSPSKQNQLDVIGDQNEEISKTENGAEIEEKVISEEAQVISDETQKEHYINKEKAMQQLEERFTKTMVEVADLTEEKQRLEHLVLQLQSETETIGEYVALYQCQRALLKQKTYEKDEQLNRLAHDREEMKIKLEELNALVKQLMQEKGVTLDIATSKSSEIDTHIHANHDFQKVNGEKCEVHEMHDSINNNEVNQENDTTKKIFALITEIKSSNLVQTVDGIQNFHPCPWCSGQLITV